MSSRSSLAAVTLLALLFVAAPAAGLQAGLPADRGPAGGPDATELDRGQTTPNGTLGTPAQVMRVELEPDGNAQWRVAVRFRLETNADRTAFDRLASRFEEGNVDALSVEPFRTAVREARAETDRDMRIRQPSRTGTVDGDTGVLALTFTWTNFARTQDDRLLVGDAFNTTSGTWLPYLTGNQTLVIVPPEGYGVRSSPPVRLENGVARWKGPVSFDGRLPWIVYSGGATTTTTTPTTTTTTPTPTTATTTTPGTESSGVPMSVFLMVVGGSILTFAAYVLYRDDRLPGAPGGTATDGTGSSGAAAETEGGQEPAVDGDSRASADVTADDSDASAGAAGGAAAGAAAEAGSDDAEAADGDEDEIDVELLSDEERVERLLERNGGRMKQANIVTETGWSNAKVSQLLSAMEEEGRIDKLRIGRENLISFPDEDVTDLDSE